MRTYIFCYFLIRDVSVVTQLDEIISDPIYNNNLKKFKVRKSKNYENRILKLSIHWT